MRLNVGRVSMRWSLSRTCRVQFHRHRSEWGVKEGQYGLVKC